VNPSFSECSAHIFSCTLLMAEASLIVSLFDFEQLLVAP
jgi:hypothetical protein